MSIINDLACAEEANTSIAARQKLKINFLEKEKAERQQHIADLEATILINKQIISDLVKNASDINLKSKQIIEKLTKENTNLNFQVKDLNKKISRIEGQALIQAQIIEENKRKEAEHLQEYKEKLYDLSEQLNKKEFIIQTLEKRCIDAENMIVKYLKHSPEAQTILSQIHSGISVNVGISNIVEQNKVLKAKVNRLTGELSKVQMLSGALSARGPPRDEMPISPSTSIIPNKDMKGNDNNARLKIENESLKNKLDDLSKEKEKMQFENDKIRQDLDELRNNYEELLQKHMQELQRSDEKSDIKVEQNISQISSIDLGTNPPIPSEPNGEQDLEVQVLDLGVKNIKQK